MSQLSSTSNPLNLALGQLDNLCRIVMSSRLRADGVEISYPAASALCFLEETPGLSGAQLARWAMVTPQTMNQILTGLERDGLLVRQADPEHGRILRAFLTAKGLAENRRCETVAEGLVEDMQAGMSRTDRGDFLRLILRCRDNMAQFAKREKAIGDEGAPAPKKKAVKVAPRKVPKKTVARKR
jgi:DNA-binding MarR family transcriptional regulator